MRRLSLLVYFSSGCAAELLWGSHQVCADERASLASVRLGVGMGEVERLLGPGKLTDRAPDPTSDNQYYYKWSKHQAQVEVIFDRNMKVVFVGLASRRRTSVPGGIVLGK